MEIRQNKKIKNKELHEILYQSCKNVFNLFVRMNDCIEYVTG